MARTWDPQRQRFPSRAERMSPSLGFRFLDSNAAALMIMPLVQ
jgi:hypothetical protein